MEKYLELLLLQRTIKTLSLRGKQCEAHYCLLLDLYSRPSEHRTHIPLDNSEPYLSNTWPAKLNKMCL